MSQAELLAHAEVRIPIGERLALDESEHYVSDLMGCEVRDRATGGLVGMVTDWEDAGGAGLLEVGEELLVPFARSICVEIDTRAKTDFSEFAGRLEGFEPLVKFHVVTIFPGFFSWTI